MLSARRFAPDRRGALISRPSHLQQGGWGQVGVGPCGSDPFVPSLNRSSRPKPPVYAPMIPPGDSEGHLQTYPRNLHAAARSLSPRLATAPSLHPVVSPVEPWLVHAVGYRHAIGQATRATTPRLAWRPAGASLRAMRATTQAMPHKLCRAWPCDYEEHHSTLHVRLRGTWPRDYAQHAMATTVSITFAPRRASFAPMRAAGSGLSPRHPHAARATTQAMARKLV